jgi:hypothetical protein
MARRSGLIVIGADLGEWAHGVGGALEQLREAVAAA